MIISSKLQFYETCYKTVLHDSNKLKIVFVIFPNVHLKWTAFISIQRIFNFNFKQAFSSNYKFTSKQREYIDWQLLFVAYVA